MPSNQALEDAIEELRGAVIATQAATNAVIVVMSGRMQAEVRRSFDFECEQARVKLLNSLNADGQLAAFDKAVADFKACFKAPR